jgi:site-specific DNA recombinase
VIPSWLTRVLRLAFLSPALVEQILDGTASAAVTGSALIKTRAIPPSWAEQDRRFGTGAAR